jgi:hypothetical protein
MRLNSQQRHPIVVHQAGVGAPRDVQIDGSLLAVSGLRNPLILSFDMPSTSAVC